MNRFKISAMIIQRNTSEIQKTPLWMMVFYALHKCISVMTAQNHRPQLLEIGITELSVFKTGFFLPLIGFSRTVVWGSSFKEITLQPFIAIGNRVVTWLAVRNRCLLNGVFGKCRLSPFIENIKRSRHLDDEKSSYSL